MKTLLLAVIALSLAVIPLSSRTASGASVKKVVAVSYAPILNTPDFAGSFSGKVPLDPCRGVRPIEFIAMPGTLFCVENEQVQNGVKVLRVTSNDYPYPSKTGLFVDARFVEAAGPAAQERHAHLPELAEIQKRLLAALGKPYVWGGNVKDGVPLLRKYYPQGDPLVGVDCSGLLYQATDGFTPRNTSTLIGYGEAVPVAGLSAEAIAGKLKPLDLLVWNGHVMVVLDNDSVIESRMGCGGKPSGVMITPRLELVRQIMKTRKPADSFPKGSAGARSFVVRRWFPAAGR
ncbi:NlpC/P60 family protein [Geomonas anaerohicana]|uniref:C40 family peptidase n=1 Tax=Geomonas anaerohicana TaxID=2798583 RepID=A0ABS0YEV1_9BACT|nr:NlpC/P60 family protein [Geomonas anaerohicana]MBJ6750836.1 C40 family peptidase [Geomonas anaerohicana]